MLKEGFCLFFLFFLKLTPVVFIVNQTKNLNLKGEQDILYIPELGTLAFPPQLFK